MATIDTITANSYTLSDSDDQKILKFTSSSAITVTCPGTVTEGVEVVCIQAGAGQITFVKSGTGEILNTIIPVTRGPRAYVAVTVEADGQFMFNGKIGVQETEGIKVMAEIDRVTISNQADVTFDVEDGKLFEIELIDVTPITGSTDIIFEINNGSWQTSSYEFEYSKVVDGVASAATHTSSVLLGENVGDSLTEGVTGSIKIPFPDDGTRKRFTVHTAYADNTTNTETLMGGGGHGSTAAITQVRVKAEGAVNLNTGTIILRKETTI